MGVVITRRHVVGVAPYSIIWTIVANYHYLTPFLSQSRRINPIVRSAGYNPNRTSYKGCFPILYAFDYPLSYTYNYKQPNYNRKCSLQLPSFQTNLLP